MSKYAPLTDYFGGQPSERSELPLTFREIEVIIGAALPPTARLDRTWWGNARASNYAARWLDGGWKVGRVDLSEGSVTFVRQSGRVVGPRRRETVSTNPGGGVYAPLERFLVDLPPRQRQVALSFAELAGVVGRSLPATALKDRAWWANTHTSPRGSSWMRAGWQVRDVYFRAQVVVFQKKGDDLLPSIPRHVKRLLGEARRQSSSDARTLAMWIRFCRVVGWYFEGTILYEKTSLPDAALSEVDRAEVDEDYDVCKRELNRYKR